ncbi:hypothetical protein, partial [uncultured Corynebacterium sp.]|uniref:hypothetical protein n=1 Tax=uncultured Corynebacterium sp. TaxID=159447 RepID=UPI0025FC2F8F
DTYSAQKTTLAEADEALETAHQRAQETGQALETAHQSTQEAYDSYAQVREENPATRVTRPDADESKNQARLDKAERRDMLALQRGARPVDRIRKEKSLVEGAQQQARSQNRNPAPQRNVATMDENTKRSQSRHL